MTRSGWLRAGRLAPEIRQREDWYRRSIERDPDAIRQRQLESWNREWQRVSMHVPYYQQLRAERRLPESFSQWEEARATLPVCDRSTLIERGTDMWSDERAPDEMRATGGSTGEPLRIPVWKSEIAHAAADMWYLRRGLGISPGDRMFLLWGHSHHLGRGWTGRMRRIRRDIADRLLGYRRWSAYDLSESGLRRAVDAMLRFRPSVLLGYSVALDRLARMNGDRRDALRTLGLRAVISTAEAFPRTDSAERLADLFDAPVLMEYGAVESGVIAHQQIDGSWLALWNTHFLEGVRRPDLGNRYELLLTSLHPRCLPLVRYRIGDLVEGDPLVDPARLPPVIGRCNDSLALPGGRFIHSEAFTHVLRDIPGIESFQVTQLTDLAIRLDYVGPQPLNERTIGEIRRRLGRVDEDLRGIEIRRTEALQQTVAGKTRFVRSVH